MSHQQIIQCPKCSATIPGDYKMIWCPRCDKPFPDDIKALVLARPAVAEPMTHQSSEHAGTTDSSSGAGVQMAQSTATPTGPSRQATALIERYKDAYLVARFVNGFGSLIKGIGIVAAILSILVGIILVVNGSLGDAVFAMGIVLIFFGLLMGIFSYFFGVLVSAQGQILKASLDGAVNSSPFLTNEHRVEIMSLPN
jgi:hypothetical protein